MEHTLQRVNTIPFTQISNYVLTSTDLSLKAKGLYAYMMSKPHGWNFTIRSMAKQLKEGVDGISSGLKELRDFGIVVYEKHSNGSGTYHIDINPNTEKPDQENPNLGKPVCISNKDLNTNKDDYNKKQAKRESVLIPEWIDVTAWSEWVQHRKDIKKPLTKTSIKKQLKLLEDNKHNHVEIINRSIQNGWTGLFKIENTSYTSKKEPEVGSIAWKYAQMSKNQDVLEVEVCDV